MKRDLLSYIFAIVVPAIVFMIGGIYLLFQEYRHTLADEETVFRNSAAAAASRERELVDYCMAQPLHNHQQSSESTLQDAKYILVTERGLGNKTQNAATTIADKSKTPKDDFELSDYFKDAKGVFIWKEDKGVTWQRGLDKSEIAAIKPDLKWVATGRNRSGRSGEYGWFEIGEGRKRVAVLWAASFRGKTVYGMVSNFRRDLSGRIVLFILAGGTMAAFLCFALLAGGAALVRSIHRVHNEALQKTTFVSNVSHELKTPLTSIITRAEMLSEGRYRTEEKRSKAAGVIAEEGRRMERMVTRLLDFSRLEHNKRKYSKSVFDLADVVRSVTGMMENLFIENGLKVSIASPCEVSADKDAVKEILENLLSNAVKYASSHGSVDVMMSRNVSGSCAISVADRGPGLTAEQMKKVFEPFWRADTSTTKETGGYGIGLSIALRLARGMGGNLTVAARDGGGLIFTFSIPC